MKNFYLLIVFLLCNIACENRPSTNQADFNPRCNDWDMDSIQEIEGVVNVSSKGEIVFEDYFDDAAWQTKTFLIPCSEGLKDYVFRAYDNFLYLKNFDEKLWVSVYGEYIKYDTLNPPRQFLFKFIALTDELEILTDSSQALRAISQGSK